MEKKKRPVWYISLHSYNFGNRDEKHPRVLLRGTLTLEDLVHELQKRIGGPRNEEYLYSISSMLMNVAEEALIEGFAINTPLGTLRPTVTGLWSPDRIQPQARHLNTAAVSYSMSKRLKTALADPLFYERTRRTTSGPVILETKDMGNHQSGGTLTPGSLLIVKGRQLLMNGDSPHRGVEIVDSVTKEAVMFIPASELQLNTRSSFILPVPSDLPEGEYLLAVTSQCCTKPTPLLSPVRRVYEQMLRTSGM